MKIVRLAVLALLALALVPACANGGGRSRVDAHVGTDSGPTMGDAGHDRGRGHTSPVRGHGRCIAHGHGYGRGHGYSRGPATPL